MRLRRLLALGVGGAAAGAAALYAAGRRRVSTFEDLDLESIDVPGRVMDVDGVRVHYVEAGSGDDAVVLIHGWNGSTFSFRHVIPDLARDYRVVAVDLKGYGYSGRPAEGDYSLAAQAELVRAVLDRLGIERAAVVGHSMGGAVAMGLAARHPQRVTRLVLVDAATDSELARGGRAAKVFVPLLPVLAAFGLRKGIRERAARSAAHDPAFMTPEVLEGYFRPMRVKGHLRAQAAQLRSRSGEEPIEPERITQPTLVLWGEHDRWLPVERGEELARRLPDAVFRRVRSAAHLPLEEQPAESLRYLRAFLAGEEPGPAIAADVEAGTSS